MKIRYINEETYRIQLEKDVKENNITTVKELLDLLYGDYNNDYRSDYKVVFKRSQYITTTKFQRFNRFWVIPLYMLTIPFQFVLKGETGVDSDSKFGKILTKIIGNY